MADFEKKIHDKLRFGVADTINDATEDRLWNGIQSGLDNLSHPAGAEHLKVVHSSSAPFSSAKQMFPLTAKIVAVIVAAVACAGILWIYADSSGAMKEQPDEVLQIQDNDTENATGQMDQTSLQADKPTISSESAGATHGNETLDETESIQIPAQLTKTVTVEENDITQEPKVLPEQKSDLTAGNSSVIFSEIENNIEQFEVDTAAYSKAPVIDEKPKPIELHTRSKDSIQPKAKTVIIQETEERIIKKRVQRRKQAKH